MRIAPVIAFCGLLLGSAPVWAQVQAEPDVAAFRRLRAEGIAAANADDLPRASRLLAEADARIPNHPGLTLMRARLAVAQGQLDEAMRLLHRLAAAGLTADPANDRALAALAARSDFGALTATFDRNRAPVGAGRITTAAELPGAVLVESAARDAARGRWLISQVRERTVVALDDAGQTRPFLASDPSIGGVLGLAMDARNDVLWAASAPVAPAVYGLSAEAPRPINALLKIDAASGRVLARYPAPAGERSLGDVATAPDGAVYVADSTGGEVFRLAPGGTALEVLLPAGTLGSPQGMALTPDGAALIVADYSSGLWRVDRSTGTAVRLAQPENASLVGVDGLTTDGRFLYGLQNGVAPQRVLKIELDAGWTAIRAVEVLAANLPEIDEPTTGVIEDGALVFVSRSQWSGFGRDGAPPQAPPSAVISRLPL